ncbi:regulatory protein RecX [Pelosinus sp. sgz500959]|uniref:regulatory protein RecX n=1 Tax=Pelosinus sp. sgz500959 TaxID=3242472 RepID=UPI0036705C4F
MPLNNQKDAWQAALYILARRSHSEYELRQKLYHKDYTIDEVDKAVFRLLEYGYLNDADFANQLFMKYSKMGKYSLYTIISKLKQHGVPDSIIQTVKNSHDSEEEWQAALKLVKKRFKSWDETNKEKIYRFLATRGFSTTVIHKVVEKMNDFEI